MGTFRADEVDKYGGNGGAGFFQLQNDKEVARVRFLYNGIEDLEGYAVHQVEINGKKRYVNCLRNYTDPIDVCPLCAEKKSPQMAKLFLKLYNIDEDKIQIWERGKKFFAKMSSVMSRYPDFVSHVFEIERHGAKGDTSTSYEMFEIGQDDSTLEDFDVPEILGGLVLDKSADDMDYFLQTGDFPPEDSEEEEQPRRRSSARETREEAPARRSATNANTRSEQTRRTPQRSSGRREF